MGKRWMKSFNSWEEAEQNELELLRNTTPEQRLEILNDLILHHEELPMQRKDVELEQIPVIYRIKK
jgi:hypothetical protein